MIQLQAEDPAPFRDVVLHACLHNQVYDAQVEESRGTYLLDLITAVGERAFFRSHLLWGLVDCQDERDLGQIIDLVALLARDGDAAARRALYDAYMARPELDTLGLDSAIVELDGAEGLLIVADHIRLDDDEEGWNGPDPRSLVGLAQKRDGAEQVQRLLNRGAEVSQRIARFLLAAREPDVGPGAYPVGNDPELTYEQIRQRMEAGDVGAGSLLVRWARTASSTDLERAAWDLARETDPRRQRQYLSMFYQRPFPLDPAPILDLATRGDELTRPPALSALRLISDPRVRSLGLQLLTEGTGRGARLLAANYEDGDYLRLEGLLGVWKDRDELHDLGFGLIEVVKAHRLVEAVPALLSLYEYGPCSSCRLRALELLGEIDTIPTRIADECRFDASPRIR